MSFFVPTRFVWRFGDRCRAVYLCGSFTRWVETVPMAPVDDAPGCFAVVVHLPPGYHQYKFIVDGKWRHDETAPFMPDPLGNVNNWLFVRRADPGPAQFGLPSNIPFSGADGKPDQLLLAQQGQPPHGAGGGSLLVSNAGPAVLHLGGHSQAHQAHSHAQDASQAQPTAMQHSAAGAAAAAAAAGGGAGASAPPLVPPQVHASPGVMSPHMQHAITGEVPGSIAIIAIGSGTGLHLSRGSTSSPGTEDIDMTSAESPRDAVSGGTIGPPVVVRNPKEPEYTRKKVADFLTSHSAYELIPESGKVTVLDVELPMRQALHALHEQGISSAALWDAESCSITGVLSASDLMATLVQLRASVAAGAPPMSEAQMDEHSIRDLREAAAASSGGGADGGTQGLQPRPLVYAKPDNELVTVVASLVANKCSMAPMLSCDPGNANSEVPLLLHTCSLSGVFACLMRHFHASLASLPLLSQPLSRLPLGTWSPDVQLSDTEMAPDAPSKDGTRRTWRKLQPLHTVTPDTSLAAAMSLLLDGGVSCLPVVDERRCLLDIYARSDVTSLCRGNSYSRLQWEDVTVGQALSLAAAAASQAPAPTSGSPAKIGGLSAALNAGSGGAPSARPALPRVHLASKEDSLRSVVERLAMPGVRRLVVVAPDTRRVEGIVSLSDVAQYLCL